MESDSSAKAGSRASSGKVGCCVPGVKVWEERREVREVGRRGVVGREGGAGVWDVEVERWGREVVGSMM